MTLCLSPKNLSENPCMYPVKDKLPYNNKYSLKVKTNIFVSRTRKMRFIDIEDGVRDEINKKFEEEKEAH